MDTKAGKMNILVGEKNVVLILKKEKLSLKTSGKLPGVTFGLRGRASIESRLFKS